MTNKMTRCDVRMYTMGTGDCFVLSFKGHRHRKPRFQLMIDCGVYNISGEKMDNYANDIIEHVEGEVDALLITHEHNDHVLGFQRSEDIFKEKLKVKELWLPWTEDEEDSLVKDWKDEMGQKKMALAKASNLLAKSVKKDLLDKGMNEESLNKKQENDLMAMSLKEDRFKEVFNKLKSKDKPSFAARISFSNALEEFRDLNAGDFSASEEYKGDLKGMKIVKELPREKKEIRYLKTGTVLEDIEGLDNIRIYILGPPKNWEDVKREHGQEGEKYKHNKDIEFVRGMSSLSFDDDLQESLPFVCEHIANCSLNENEEESDGVEAIKDEYEKKGNEYRRIDHDWLASAANLSLRLTEHTNNLSSVIAIEFIESGKVMLFTGDAEFGNWNSWHDIKWDEKGKDGTTHLTTDLLNRTVFYKVAHHLSHNGTTRKKGLDLMTHKDLVAMAPLDYDKISSGWKKTMPNRDLVRDLLNKTRGRLILLNSNKLFFDKAETVELKDEIEKRLTDLSTGKRTEYKKRLTREEFYVEYEVDGT